MEEKKYLYPADGAAAVSGDLFIPVEGTGDFFTCKKEIGDLSLLNPLVIGRKITEEERKHFEPIVYGHGSFSINAERSYKLKNKCDNCGEELYAIHICSPYWTWNESVGMAGYAIYCRCSEEMLEFCPTMES